MKSKKIATIGILTALALIISLFEALLPPIIPILPFAKVGLSQIVILSALIILGPFEASVVLLVRSLLVAIFVGNPSMMLYSIPAGIISLALMTGLLKSKSFSIIAISMASGAIHNLVQITVASFITKSTAVFFYAPYLMIFGAIAGVVTGLACYILIKKLPERLLIND